MSDALELVLRYFVASACGWLAGKGLQGFADDNIVSAMTMITSGVVVWLLMVARGLFKSSVDYIVDRLKAHHKPALVAAAAEVVAADPNAAVK